MADLDKQIVDAKTERTQAKPLSGQLREAKVCQRVAGSGLSEVRDLREVITCAMAMDCTNRKEIARAMGVLSQRIVAAQAAKGRKGGSWEKAEALELIPGSAVAMLPGGMASLLG